MFGRYQAQEVRNMLPSEWKDSVIALLEESYAEENQKLNRFFDVYGAIYPEELLVIISSYHQERPEEMPISLFISHDIIDDQKKMDEALKSLIKLASLIIDDFMVEDWSDYIQNWTKNEYHGHDFHYKISRENVSLTLQANALLLDEEK